MRKEMACEKEASSSEGSTKAKTSAT